MVKEGSALTLVSHGHMMQLAKEATRVLGEKGIDVELIDLRTIRPLDIETVAQSVRKTHFCLLIEEGHLFGGIAAEVGFEIQEHCFDFLDAPVSRVSQRETPMPYSKVLERETLPTLQRVLSEVERMFACRLP